MEFNVRKLGCIEIRFKAGLTTPVQMRFLNADLACGDVFKNIFQLGTV